MPAELVALAHQKLLAEADADERPVCRGEVEQRSNEVQPPQVFHRVAEGADAGQNGRVRGKHVAPVRGDKRIETDLGTGVQYAEEVAQTVIDDRNSRLGHAHGLLPSRTQSIANGF